MIIERNNMIKEFEDDIRRLNAELNVYKENMEIKKRLQ